MGKYHPHGDTAIYDTLVRMAQDFSLRYPLIDGQGNFGSVDGDNAGGHALHRVPPARRSPTSCWPTSTRKRSTSSRTTTARSRSRRSCRRGCRTCWSTARRASRSAWRPTSRRTTSTRRSTAASRCSTSPRSRVDELIEIIPAPDFPTAGIIYGLEGVREGYRTGRGRVVIRARTHVEDLDKGERQAIIVDEIPYQVNKANLLIRIGELVREKKLEGISDLRDESDKSGMRVVIELKRGEVPEIVLNNLYKLTQLQDSFGMNMVALVDDQPRLLNLKQFLEFFLQHRREVVVRRTRFELRKARERGHILEGLAVALSNVDEIIALIKASATPAEAKHGADGAHVALAAGRGDAAARGRRRRAARRPAARVRLAGATARGYRLSDAQAQRILEMRLQRLTGLEQDKITAEYREVMELIADLLDILAKPARVTADHRATSSPRSASSSATSAASEIVAQGEDLSIEDLIAPEDMVVTLSHGGYMKAQPVAEYRAQRRGGRGKQATATKEDDFVDRMFIANTHDYILCFSNRGRVYWLKVYNVPQGTRSVARQADRQPRAAGRATRRSRRSCRSRSSPRTSSCSWPPRMGTVKKTPLVRLLAAAAVGHHRGRPRRRRPPDRRGAHRRQARRDAVQLRRQGGALRRERRAADGPQRARRARHDARRRARRSSRCWSPRTRRSRC